MFSTLRQNSDLYMLDKTGTPTLKKGKVLMTKPTQSFYTNPLDSTVEITASVDGNTVEFKNIPSGLSVAIMGNAIITETKELMCQEVKNMLSNSRQVIDSIPYHNEVISSCDSILSELNPLLAKEKLQEEKIGTLETKVTGMENTLTDIKAMLSKVLDKE